MPVNMLMSSLGKEYKRTDYSWKQWLLLLSCKITKNVMGVEYRAVCSFINSFIKFQCFVNQLQIQKFLINEWLIFFCWFKMYNFEQKMLLTMYLIIIILKKPFYNHWMFDEPYSCLYYVLFFWKRNWLKNFTYSDELEFRIFFLLFSENL